MICSKNAISKVALLQYYTQNRSTMMVHKSGIFEVAFGHASNHSYGVQLLKSHVLGQIIVNLSQIRFPCYEFDVPKPYVNYNKIKRFYSQVIGPYTSADVPLLRCF